MAQRWLKILLEPRLPLTIGLWLSHACNRNWSGSQYNEAKVQYLRWGWLRGARITRKSKFYCTMWYCWWSFCSSLTEHLQRVFFCNFMVEHIFSKYKPIVFQVSSLFITSRGKLLQPHVSARGNDARLVLLQPRSAHIRKENGCAAKRVAHASIACLSRIRNSPSWTSNCSLHHSVAFSQTWKFISN